MSIAETAAVDNAPRPSWNVVATVHKGAFARAWRILKQFGEVRRTGFYNVLLASVDDPRAVVAELARRARETPDLLDCFARVMPADAVFEFSSVEEFEDKAREQVLHWAPLLAGRSFHVRLHRRGFKGRLHTPHEEHLLDDVLLSALAAAETPATISFADPDAVIDVETVGDHAAMSLWTREEVRANPFLRLD